MGESERGWEGLRGVEKHFFSSLTNSTITFVSSKN